MQRIPRDQARKYAFDWRDEPLLNVEPGESVRGRNLRRQHRLFQVAGRQGDPRASVRASTARRRSPILSRGPIFVEGVEKGDVLVVIIEEIVVDDYSWIAIGPRRGPLGESTRWPELSSDYTTKIFRHTPGPSGTTRDGTLHFNDKISWPITPFIGTLGVAPDREVTAPASMAKANGAATSTSATSAPAIASSCPSIHAGGLFYLGDVHASQGDTEFTGTAAETKATVRLRFDVIKEQTHSRHAHREAGLPCRRPRQPPARSRRRNRDVSTDGLADLRLRLHADRRLLSGQHLPRFSDQRLSDVQDRQAELCGGSGDSPEVSGKMNV